MTVVPIEPCRSEDSWGSTIDAIDEIGSQVSPPRSTEHFIYDLKTAQTKEDILVFLSIVSNRFDYKNQEQMDQEVINGTLQQLVRSLHQRLLVRPLQQGHNKQYHKKLEQTRALQVMVLCSAIDRILSRCSETVLDEFGHELQDDLSASLPRIICLFAAWKDDSMCRLVTLGNIIQIIRRMVAKLLLQHVINDMGEALLVLLDEDLDIPLDIRVDAACALTCLIQNGEGNHNELIDQIAEKSSFLISILSAAGTVVASNNHLEDVLDALGYLAAASPVISSKMTKRHCTALVCTKHLTHEESHIRKKATALCIALISNYEKSKDNTSVLECNLDLIASALIKATLEEKEPSQQHSMVTALAELTKLKSLHPDQIFKIVKALYVVAVRQESDAPSIEAAVAYIQIVEKAINSEETLSKVVDFLTSPYAKVRNQALKVLNDISFWNPHSSELLLEKTDMLENFGLITVHGSDQDCTDVVQICRRLIFTDQNHKKMCNNASFLGALAQLVTKDPILNRAAYTAGVEVILTLASKEENVECFLPFTETLLPCLVRLANRTTDQDLKERLVSTAVRFTSALVERDESNSPN